MRIQLLVRRRAAGGGDAHAQPHAGRRLLHHTGNPARRRPQRRRHRLTPGQPWPAPAQVAQGRAARCTTTEGAPAAPLRAAAGVRSPEEAGVMPHGGVGELDEVDSRGARSGQTPTAGPPSSLCGAARYPLRSGSCGNPGTIREYCQAPAPVRRAMASRRTGPSDQLVGRARARSDRRRLQSPRNPLRAACRWAFGRGCPSPWSRAAPPERSSGRAASLPPVARQECDKCIGAAVPWGDRLTISVAPLTYLKT